MGELSEEPKKTNAVDAGQRAAPARLGLGAVVACTAPVLPHLDRSANAQVVPSPCSNQGQQGSPCLVPWTGSAAQQSMNIAATWAS